MNRKGQYALVGIMYAVLIFVMVVSLVEPIKTESAAARVNLNCSSADLTAGQESTCILTDSYLFGFVGMALAVGLGWVGVKKLGGFGETK